MNNAVSITLSNTVGRMPDRTIKFTMTPDTDYYFDPPILSDKRRPGQLKSNDFNESISLIKNWSGLSAQEKQSLKEYWGSLSDDFGDATRIILRLPGRVRIR